MNSRIGANQGQDGGCNANDRTRADVPPASVVRKSREDGLGVRHGRDDPECDDDAQPSKDVDHQNDPLRQGKFSGQDSLEDDREQRYCDREQVSVPGFVAVAWIVQHQEYLDLGAPHECGGGCGCLLAQDAQPPHQVTQESLVLARSEFGDPVVLVTTCRSPT